jgi:dTDP-4-amino-4,6-dideoxygalactose transaminase
MNNHLPMLDLKREYRYMKSEIDAAIQTCMEHQRWILGPEVGELESRIAAYLGANHCIGASSGTDALVLALRSLAISRTGRQYFDPSQQILTTAFTFTATGDSILHSGATPVFVDIDPETFNMDVSVAKRYIEENPGAVVGILPVHLYGRSCDMDAILKLARENNLFVVEDVAQAFGGTFCGKKLGTLGDAGTFSFFPSKNLGGFGDGGMVSTNSEELAGLIRMLTKHGGKDKYNVDHIGYNARLDTLQAAILLARMNHVDDFNRRRRTIAARYNEFLAGHPALTTPTDDPGNVWHQYTLRVANSRRDELQAHLGKQNVSTMIYYPYPLYAMGVFSGNRFKTAGLMNYTEEACKSVLSLPMEPLMDENMTDRVIEAVNQWA